MARMRPLARRAVVLVAAALVLAPAARATKDEKAKAEKPKCGAGLFCAGAATGDITPPVTSPQFAYTFRNCAVATPTEIGSHVLEFSEDHVEEGQNWLLQGGPSCAASKAAPDTELYNKTWPPSEGTYGRLQANAFVLDDGKGQRVAIVQADLGGIPGQLHTYVAKRIEALGIDRSHLLISATHTHGGPGGIFQDLGYATAGGDQFDPRIFEAVSSGVVTAIERAAARLTPAKLAVGFGTIKDANHNRRGEAWELNPEKALGDTEDAERLMLIRLDTTKGLPLGVITNFANHGVIHGTFNYWLSGDNQATTTRRVAAGIAAAAQAEGVKLPRGWKVVDALINGAPGDITPESDDAGWNYDHYGYLDDLDNPPPFKQFARFENAGMRQAPEALRLWKELGDELTSDVTLDARLDFVCMCGQEVGDDPHDPFDRGEHEPENDDPAYRSVSREGILGFDDGTTFPTTVFPSHHHEAPRLIAAYPAAPISPRVQIIRINDLGLASMPGEPTIQMGRRIERSVKAASQGLLDNVVTVGLANDYASYMATIQEYEAYRYEGSFSLWGQQTGNLMKERLVQLTDAMREARDLGPCTEDRGFFEPPDTSGLAVAPAPLVPDVGVGTVEAQPVDVARFTGTSFAWVGGGPSAEWSPNDPLVELQRQVGKKWRTVASDLDPEVPVRYKKYQGTNHWRAFFDPTKDWQPGTYRFHVTGRGATGPMTAEPYVLDSEPFTVVPSKALTIVQNKDGSFSVVHPAPHPLANYRYRERVASTAKVNATYPATFTLPKGQTLVVPPGGIVDAWGNTNGEAITLTG